MKKQKVYIYGLSGCDNIIRYVGKTIKEPNIRKSEHISESKTKKSKTHKVNWINKLIKAGDDINIHILEECNISNWEEKEIYWINQFNNLTNTAAGGLSGNNISKFTLSYNEVKNWVNINLPNIKSETNWRKLSNLPHFIPKRPDVVYKNKGWISYNDFFNNIFLNLNELKIWVNKNNIKNLKEYNKIKIKNMPFSPANFYKNKGWISYYNFFNKEKIINTLKIHYNYNELKCILKPLLLKSKCEYINWYKFNKNILTHKIPADPKLFYKNKGWISYNDFFGNTFKYKKNIIKKRNTQFLSYINCKDWVFKNLPNITSEKMWRTISPHLPKFIPKRPDVAYKNKGWISWTKLNKGANYCHNCATKI